MNQSSEKIIFKCNAQKYEIPKNKIEKVLYGKQRKVDSTEVGSDIVFFDFFVGYIEICLKKNFFEKLFRIKKRIYKKYYSNYHYQVNSNNTLDNKVEMDEYFDVLVYLKKELSETGVEFEQIFLPRLKNGER